MLSSFTMCIDKEYGLHRLKQNQQFNSIFTFNVCVFKLNFGFLSCVIFSCGYSLKCSWFGLQTVFREPARTVRNHTVRNYRIIVLIKWTYFKWNCTSNVNSMNLYIPANKLWSQFDIWVSPSYRRTHGHLHDARIDG